MNRAEFLLVLIIMLIFLVLGAHVAGAVMAARLAP